MLKVCICGFGLMSSETSFIIEASNQMEFETETGYIGFKGC